MTKKIPGEMDRGGQGSQDRGEVRKTTKRNDRAEKRSDRDWKDRQKVGNKEGYSGRSEGRIVKLIDDTERK